MTAMSATMRQHTRSARTLRLGVIAGVVTALVAFAIVGLVAGRHDTRTSGDRPQRVVAAQRAQLTQWEAAVHPLVLSAGQVVALGPRQGVQQLQGHEFSPATNQHMAAGWVARLTQLHAQVVTLTTPRFLANAQSLLDRSLAGYVTASQDLLAASTATGARRASLLEDANIAGRAADRLYDQATADVAARRAGLGLPVDWSGSS